MKQIVAILFIFIDTFNSVECDDLSAHRTIYEFSVKDSVGKEVSLEKYRGQVVVIVNVASQCGYTDVNYRQLKELQDKYYNEGFRVAAFPCNQFGSQEPSGEAEIVRFVKEQFGYEAEIYGKVKVNGADADVFWQWLKEEQGGSIVNAIKWNFTKFLVDRNGHVIHRYAPTTSPSSFEGDIQQLLAE